MIKLTTDEIKYIAMFENMTRATVKDCIINENNITFLIKEGEMGLAIGKKGNNIKMAQKLLGKRINIFEYSNNINKFIQNIFSPAKVSKIEQNGDSVRIFLDSQSKRQLRPIIKHRIPIIKQLLERHFKIKRVSVV